MRNKIMFPYFRLPIYRRFELHSIDNDIGLTFVSEYCHNDGYVNDSYIMVSCYMFFRPIFFSNTDVFVICFSTVYPSSFTEVVQRWIPEIRQTCPAAPLLLVGNQIDLLDDENTFEKLKSERQKPVTAKKAKRLARRIGAKAYVECSALTRHGVQDIFEHAAKIATCKNIAASKQSHIKCRIL